MPEVWNGVKKKRGYGVFIREGYYQLSEKQQMSATFGTICTAVQMVHRTFRSYPKGISKSSVRLYGPAYVRVLFAECTYGHPPAYVHTRNRNGHPPNTAYVHTRNKTVTPEKFIKITWNALV